MKPAQKRAQDRELPAQNDAKPAQGEQRIQEEPIMKNPSGRESATAPATDGAWDEPELMDNADDDEAEEVFGPPMERRATSAQVRLLADAVAMVRHAVVEWDERADWSGWTAPDVDAAINDNWAQVEQSLSTGELDVLPTEVVASLSDHARTFLVDRLGFLPPMDAELAGPFGHAADPREVW
jgi:hypothetical protein